MGTFYLLCLVLFVYMHETTGQLLLPQNKTLDKNGLFPSAESGKVSNVLKVILTRETLERISMTNKIQSLIMDSIQNKNFRQAMETKYSNVVKELHDLETKDERIEAENAKLKRELRKNNDDIRSETLVLKNNNLKLTKESQILKEALNQMNETLHNISANNVVDRLLTAEAMVKTMSDSLNKALDTALGNLNESTWQWSRISNTLIDYTEHYSDCWAILRKYPSQKGIDGIYKLTLSSQTKFVFCDMTTEGGGWTAIQRRQDGSTDFYRTWSEYKQGFGDPTKNYWIGNDAINELTKNKDQELRVDLQRFNGDTALAQYSTFYVGDEDSKYKITVSGYSGTAGDSMAWHNGMKFSTKDQDNDIWSGGNCATQYHGVWWYNVCANSNLNGLYGQSGDSGTKYTSWYTWKSNREALKQTMMMIRHRN